MIYTPLLPPSLPPSLPAPMALLSLSVMILHSQYILSSVMNCLSLAKLRLQRSQQQQVSSMVLGRRAALATQLPSSSCISPTRESTQAVNFWSPWAQSCSHRLACGQEAGAEQQLCLHLLILKSNLAQSLRRQFWKRSISRSCSSCSLRSVAAASGQFSGRLIASSFPRVAELKISIPAAMLILCSHQVQPAVPSGNLPARPSLPVRINKKKYSITIPIGLSSPSRGILLSKLCGESGEGKGGRGRGEGRRRGKCGCGWGVIIEMQSGKKGLMLSVKSITWYKDSHSLFDYESNKINTNSFAFPVATKHVALYRKRQTCNVVAVDSKEAAALDKDEFQFLTKFEIKPTQPASSRFRLNFINDTDRKLKKINSERTNTEESNSVSLREEETYLIVRKQKDANGEPKGYRLEPGQTIKLGRVEFFVSEVCVGEKAVTAKGKEKANAGKLTIRYNSADYKEEGGEKRACKICLEETEEKDNFLFNPCKCSGSCGTVHLECLLQWINIKVKKEVVGGTLHYNFEKFECEVCKAELPVVVETEDQRVIEMLPIEKPKGNYLILEGACEKTKSVMMIQNVPEGGIKLGRGHDCEIRITDISVSRNHALIKFNGSSFSIFDNKSKFGTLVKEDNMNVEVGSKHQQGIQIGRTVVILDVCKESDIKEKQEREGEHKTTQHLPSKKAIDRESKDRR